MSFSALEDNAPDGGLDIPTPWETTNQHNSDLETSFDAQIDRPLSPPVISTQPVSTKKNKVKRLEIEVIKVETTKNNLTLFFNATAKLPRFKPTYHQIRRTHSEMTRFADHLSNANPECFVPAIPNLKTSISNSDLEHEMLIKKFQKWFDRVCRSPLLVRDDEFLHFLEATTGYVPSVRFKPPATGLARKMVKQLSPPEDACLELKEFRPAAKMMYQLSGEEFAIKIDQLCHSRRQMAQKLQKLSASVSKTDFLGNDKMVNRMQQVEHLSSIKELKLSELTMATLGDTMEQVSRDMYIVKETLTNRHLLMRDLLKSQSSTKEKHQRATRLRGSNNISPVKVDEAITQLEQAAHLEKRITNTVHRVTDNLVAEKQLVINRLEADILEALSSFALQSIDAERASLSAWEDSRFDIRRADPRGGLSLLGREGEVAKRKRFSQSLGGDEWSDRPVRANETRTFNKREDDVLDSVQAARLLAAD